jgi:hypothetical protein
MLRFLFILPVFCVLSGSVDARRLSPDAEISALTCCAGKELYSAFGHSAFRVCDTAQGIDLVFNYGTFDFNAPGFYTNFVRGKLDYMLSVSRFDRFMSEYEYDGRCVIEQTLNLNLEQKQALFDFLVNNSRPENKYYRYDFLFDNCSSRLRDALTAICGTKVEFAEYPQGKPATFRMMLYEHLKNMPWSKLGIDLLLGRRVDYLPAPYQHMFLPDCLMSAFETGTIDGQPLVSARRPLYTPPQNNENGMNLTHPTVVFSIFAFLVIVCSLLKLRMRIFDFVFFLATGLFGLFLVFMWFGTEHYVTKYNCNLLWAFPAHAFVAFALLKKRRPRWVDVYFMATAALCLLILLLWKALAQHLNTALIPIIGVLMIRAFRIRKQ